MANNNLGKYRAEITADTRKYRKELGGAQKSSASFQKSASAMSSAVAAIDGPFGGISSRISAFTSLATKGGAAVGLIAGSISALGAVTISTTGHMAKLEVATAKTEALLKATGGAAGYNAAQLDLMARSVALNTLASTEGIRNAQNALLTFKSISGPVFDDTIMLSQDMAAVFGGDAKTSALQLGKALEDPLTGLSSLRRVGVTFSAQQKEQIKLMVEVGDKAKAQTLILAELEKQIGGAGAAEATGLSGAVDTLSQRWEEMLEAWDKTTGTATKAKAGVSLLSRALNGVRASLAPTDQERLNELVLKRKDIEEDIARISGSSYRRKDFDLRALRNEKSATISEIQDIQNRRIEEIKAGASAQVNAEKIKNSEIAASDKIAESKRLEETKARLAKEVDAVAASLLSKEEKENAYHQKRIASLEKLAELDPSRGSTVSSLKTAEHERHLNEIARLDSEAKEKERVAEFDEYERQLVKNDSHVALFRDMEAEKTEAAAVEAERRVDLEKSAQSSISSLHKSTWQEAANFIGVFAGKSKVAAIASIAISKGLAIAQTVAHTQTASMLAFSSQLIPGDPTSLARAAAAAASVESMGAIKVGLIAATGLAQAAQVSSGGAGDTNYGSPGTNASNVYQPNQSTIPISSAEEDSAKGVQIIFNGDVNGMDAEHLANTIKDYLDDTDFVLVEPHSRNGQALVA